MARRTTRKIFPNTGASDEPVSVSVNLAEAQASASIVVPKGEYLIEFAEAKLFHAAASNTDNVALMPKIIGKAKPNIEGKNVRVRALCICDGKNGDWPKITDNRKLLADIMDAAAVEFSEYDLTSDEVVHLVGRKVIMTFADADVGKSGEMFNSIIAVETADGDDDAVIEND
ncbi:hypothetical protein HGD85_02925 [Rhodobacteraceae bacterium R_SAG10]|nr:hypothetical protein [Rhodobacteraceae bacterium R_SAG10]